MSRRAAAGLLQTLLARNARTALASSAASLKASHGLVVALRRLQQLPGVGPCCQVDMRLDMVL